MSLRLSAKKTPGTCFIDSIHGAQAARLLEMGITPGLPVEVIRSAPLGFPIEIKVRGYALLLRKAEADCIEIKY